MSSPANYFARYALLVQAGLLLAGAPARPAADLQRLIQNLQAAYSDVKTYQATVEIRRYRNHQSIETEKFRYTFMKPNRIRIDFLTPRQGMVLIYPDAKGKVQVHPFHWAPFVTLHLSPDSPLLQRPSGQRIDQTDLGQLIDHIADSLGDGRRGPVKVAESDGCFAVSVLTEDHFRRSIATRYRFVIDKSRWLPVRVDESTPEGRLKRTVIFHDLKINSGVTEGDFQINGG